MSGVEPHIRVGQIVGTHGVKGGLKVRLLTDFHDRFEPGSTLYIKDEPYRVTRSTWHKDQVRIQLKGLTSMAEAELLKWEYVTVPEDSRPHLEEGEFLERELLGMTIVTVDGVRLGSLDEVIHLPAHDVFRTGETMIPVVKEFVQVIDPQERKIVVTLIPGMIPEAEVET